MVQDAPLFEAPLQEAPLPGALAVYKNKPALVTEKIQDKIVIALQDGGQIKVREKDIAIIHPGPVKNFDGIRHFGGEEPKNAARESWELLLAEEKPVSLKELAELAFGEYSPAYAWSAFCLLLDGLYFTGTTTAIVPRKKEQVEENEKKREEKQKASGERELFLARLKNRRLDLSSENSDDRRFMQDVEALAMGNSGKSRTMKDIGMGETPEEAHALLLECGLWTNHINPYPGRFGVSRFSAQQGFDPPPEEDRRDLTHLAAFAIDSPWSHDPDDAVSIENEGGRRILYVHIADPAASVTLDSPAEREARDRGATLYLPEGSFRMLAEEALPAFALGIAETSPALTFKMAINGRGDIEDTEIFPAIVKVQRLTYKEADELMAGTNGDNAVNSAALQGLCAVADRNINRRCTSGAISITLPEIHISLNRGQVFIEPIIRYQSADMIRECMLLAGEGAGLWAIQRKLPFPYIQQETEDIPGNISPGMAGAYQLRRCMRPRILSTKPGLHGGLGLDTYTQVTSPLRRYTDLLTHIQIRSFLRGGTVIPADKVSARIAAGEAAAAAVTQAERASRNHWTMVYLSDKKDSVWEAVALEKKGNRWAAVIPALALETQIPLRKEIAPNEPLRLMLKSVNIPRGEAVFIAEE